MIETYLLIEKRIIEEEQNRKQREEYGQEIIKTLSKELKTNLVQVLASASFETPDSFMYVLRS
jgi:hypothetical protein